MMGVSYLMGNVNILYSVAFLALLLGYAFMFSVHICIGPLMIIMLLGPYPRECMYLYREVGTISNAKAERATYIAVTLFYIKLFKVIDDTDDALQIKVDLQKYCHADTFVYAVTWAKVGGEYQAVQHFNLRVRIDQVLKATGGVSLYTTESYQVPRGQLHARGRRVGRFRGQGRRLGRLRHPEELPHSEVCRRRPGPHDLHPGRVQRQDLRRRLHLRALHPQLDGRPEGGAQGRCFLAKLLGLASDGAAVNIAAGAIRGHKVDMLDARQEKQLVDNSGASFATRGFAWLQHTSSVQDFKNDDEVRAKYCPELINEAKRLTGADKIVVASHVFRQVGGEVSKAGTLGGAMMIHGDFDDSRKEQLEEMVAKSKPNVLAWAALPSRRRRSAQGAYSC